MIDANDIQRRGEAIQGLFGEDKISDGLVALMDFVREFSDENDAIREVTVISADYRNLKNAQTRKTIDYGEFTERRRPLLFQALELKDSVAESLSRQLGAG